MTALSTYTYRQKTVNTTELRKSEENVTENFTYFCDINMYNCSLCDNWQFSKVTYQWTIHFFQEAFTQNGIFLNI